MESLDVKCTVTLDEVGDKGHLIVSSELDVDGAGATGIDAAGFERAVAGRRRGLLLLGADPGERFR